MRYQIKYALLIHLKLYGFNVILDFDIHGMDCQSRGQCKYVKYPLTSLNVGHIVLIIIGDFSHLRLAGKILVQRHPLSTQVRS